MEKHQFTHEEGVEPPSWSPAGLWESHESLWAQTDLQESLRWFPSTIWPVGNVWTEGGQDVVGLTSIRSAVISTNYRRYRGAAPAPTRNHGNPQNPLKRRWAEKLEPKIIRSANTWKKCNSLLHNLCTRLGEIFWGSSFLPAGKAPQN